MVQLAAIQCITHDYSNKQRKLLTEAKLTTLERWMWDVLVHEYSMIISHSMVKESINETDNILGEKLSHGHISVPKELQHLLDAKDKVYDKYSREISASKYRLEEICGV